MTDQPAQDQAECSATSVQIPYTLDIDLPHVDPEDVYFTINKFLIQLTPENWEFLEAGFVTCDMMIRLANYFMDVIQMLSESILDVVMPQVYNYMRTYGTFSPTVLGLTEDRINDYLGDSIKQALANCMKIEVQKFVAKETLPKLLLRHITKTVNSVLALSTQTPILESSIPVVFVSGCVTSTEDLKYMVLQFANIMSTALVDQQPVRERINTPSSDPSSDGLVIPYSKRDFKKLVKTYIVRMVKLLTSRAQMPNFKMSSSNRRDVCIRVGTNAHILTVENSGQVPAMSHSSFDAIPGAVPESNDSANSSPSSSVTVIGTTNDLSHHSALTENISIENIADDLVEAFLNDLQGAAQTDVGGLELIDNIKLREFTDRLFNVVMSGHDYQIPLVPAGRRMCDTVIYRKLRGGHIINPAIVTHSLYMRTEEVVARCAVQIVLWSELQPKGSNCSSPYTSYEFSEDPDFVLPRVVAGDGREEESTTPSPQPPSPSGLSQHSDSTYAIPELLGPTQLQMVGIVSLLVGQVLVVIGIRDGGRFFETVRRVVEELCDLDPNHFHGTLMGRSYKEIHHSILTDLLLEFHSDQVMQEMVRSENHSFEEAIIRAVRKQLRIPSSSVPYGNAAKKKPCGFFKKFKRLCCKKTSKTSDKTTTVSDQDNSELQDHLSKKELFEDHREQCQCPLMRRVAASTRNICSSSRKMFSSIGRAFSRPFVACFSPESQ